MVSPAKPRRPRQRPTRRQVVLALLTVTTICICSAFLLRHEDAQVAFAASPSLRTEKNGAQPGSKMIAILVGGSFQRFLLNSTLHHLLSPLVQQEHHQVDYFLLLATNRAPPAYRAELPYMNHLRWDPIFGDEEMLSQDEIGTRIRSLVKDTGASLRSMRLLPSVNVTDARLERKREKARADFPNEDVDLRFPMKDLRPKAMQRTANGNRNMLNLFYGLQLLWGDLLVAEESLRTKYDYIMIFRDDTLWLQDFSMNKLLETKADAYVLSCNARVPPMLSHEINDHAIVVSREKAQVVGRYYKSLFDADLEACGEAVKDEMGEKRGCNSEMILKWILKEHSIDVQEVPQSLIPFQRSVNVAWEGEVVPCFHKYCQSKEAPLIADPPMKACKTLKFE